MVCGWGDLPPTFSGIIGGPVLSYRASDYLLYHSIQLRHDPFPSEALIPVISNDEILPHYSTH